MTTAAERNPLKFDEELVDLLNTLGNIKTYKRFKRWKNSFLDRFETFLAKPGIERAENGYSDFKQVMTKTTACVDKCDGFVQKGDLTKEKVTVKGRNSLNELYKNLTICCDDTEALIPSVRSEERRRGYNKFQLGAVLLRDDFSEFDRMKYLDEVLRVLGEEKLREVANNQQLDLFFFYAKKFRKFCDILADLGLYEVMLACRKFAEEPEEEEPDFFEIIIKASDGKAMRLERDSTDTIGDVKEAIADIIGLKPDQQALNFNGKKLDVNDQTLEGAGIQDRSVLSVASLKMPLKVRTMDGEEIEVMVHANGNLSDIKMKLEEETSLSPKNQRLFLSGDELTDDSKSAVDYGIQAGDVIDMEPKSIQVSINIPDGKVVTIDIKPSDNVGDIKEKIAEKSGIATPRQVVKHKGEELPKGITVKDMGIQDGAELKVDIFKVPVTVKTMEGKKIKTMVDPTITLREIKEQLEEGSGIPPNHQNLIMNGVELGDDNKTTADYGIEADFELDLEPKLIKVNATTPDGKSHVVEIRPSDTADEMKEKIAAKSLIAAHHQVIKYQSKELPKDGTKVRDMDIKEGSNVEVEILKIPITVNTMDGKKIEVAIHPMDTMKNIKVAIEEESGISHDIQRLFFNGIELDDDSKSATEYGIQAGSELDMEPKYLKIEVESPDGKTHTVEIAMEDTTDDVKEKIAEIAGIEVPRQVVTFMGKELPKNGMKVRDMGLKNGSKLNVEIFRIPVTVNSMDGKQIKIMVDPTDKVKEMKLQLQEESGLSPGNQRLFMQGGEISDDERMVKNYAIEAGTSLELEPKAIKLHIGTPSGKTHEVEVALSDIVDEVKEKIALETGITVPRQVLKFCGNELPGGKTVKDMDIRHGSALAVEIFKIPLKIYNVADGRTISIDVEPVNRIDEVKEMLKKETQMEPKRQRLQLGDEELAEGGKTVIESGVTAGCTLRLDEHMDPIIFVDIKCGTLFAMDRDMVIEKEALTPHQGNKLEFMEAAQGSASKEKIAQVLKGSPRLGVATQLVVESTEIEDYNVEAEKLKSKWGVTLKKREKNKKGEELIFVDPKTGASGELARKKYLDMKFITPISDQKEGETLEEREKDTGMYDKYVYQIRDVFGIKISA